MSVLQVVLKSFIKERTQFETKKQNKKKELKMLDDFKPGDVVLHKATLKRCVIKEVIGGEVIVTTEDDKEERYLAIELEPYREPYIT